MRQQYHLAELFQSPCGDSLFSDPLEAAVLYANRLATDEFQSPCGDSLFSDPVASAPRLVS